MNALQIDAALVRSAQMARKLALEHCGQTVRGHCSWYHGVWQFFRALGVIKTAGGSAVYFDEVLRTLAAEGDTHRVLISGGADDAMSLVALAAFRAANRPLDLAMVDLCETPLALARWSAQEFGASVTTHRSDILAFDRAADFDVVMTNSFLGEFDPAARVQLFARWAALLRRGGKLVLTNRLRPGSGHEALGFTSDQAQAFCATVRRQAERAKAILGLEPEMVESWARAYTERHRAYPVRSVDEVLELLRSAGFAPERIETTHFAGKPGQEAVAGPSAAEHADYVRVLAKRM
jgi:SAM-dependent methyltransferase